MIITSSSPPFDGLGGLTISLAGLGGLAAGLGGSAAGLGGVACGLDGSTCIAGLAFGGLASVVGSCGAESSMPTSVSLPASSGVLSGSTSSVGALVLAFLLSRPLALQYQTKISMINRRMKEKAERQYTYPATVLRGGNCVVDESPDEELEVT